MTRSVTATANEVIPFPLAARWAGIVVHSVSERGTKVYCPFGEVEHPDGGTEPAMRIYPDHGWCFAEQRYFSVVSLLAEVWQLSYQDAAAEALRRYGWKPATYAHLWEQASGEEEPDHDALAQALLVWCEAVAPDWSQRQYDDRTARVLGRCLGLLPLVRTGDECRTWLEGCKRALAPYLT